MKKIVVFGASGDVGRYFIDYLLTQKAEYQIIAVGHRKSFSIFKDCPSVQYYPIDITQKVSSIIYSTLQLLKHNKIA